MADSDTNKQAELRLFAIQEKANEPALLTPWSIPHTLAGAAAKEVGISLLHWEIIHGLYELKDQIINERGDVNNSLWNTIGDIAATTVGHHLAHKKGSFGWWTLGFFVSWAGAVTLGDSIG